MLPLVKMNHIFRVNEVIMRNRTITCALLIISLLLFLCYFVLLNTIQPPGNVIVKYLNDIITYTQQDNWQEV